MKIFYTRSSEKSRLNINKMRVEHLYGINFLEINDVDHIKIKNLRCGGNKNHTLFIPRCLEVNS